jgi:RNA polymerase sigma-54 factor
MGYIRRSVPDMVDDMVLLKAFTPMKEGWQKKMQVIHELEPSGVGAQDLQECLLLQLKTQNTHRICRTSRYYRKSV